MIAKLKKVFRLYFLTGLLVLGPLVISGYVIKAIVDGADSALQTYRWFPFPIPGLGVVLAVIIILFCGFLGKNFLGRFLIDGAGDVVGRIPIVGGIYSSTKQVFETLFGDQNRHFGRVVLIRYPHLESWTLAFVTSEDAPVEVQRLVSQKLLSVYIPTTPNPTSGFYIYVPASDAKTTNLTVEEAFKIIVSLGMVHLPASGIPAAGIPTAGPVPSATSMSVENSGLYGK